ncbi:TMEM43 family protein, partial [bacterium]|nr:TMEM43 family protein [bacterium]
MNSLLTDTIIIPWHVRLVASFKSAGFGVLIALLSLPIFVLNEYQAYHDIELIKHIQEHIDDSNHSISYISGETTTSKKLVDSQFSVETDGIHLNRDVYMYQWREIIKTKVKKKIGGKEEVISVYEYHKEFSNHPIDSSQFKNNEDYINPPFMYHSKSFSQQSVHIDKVQLSKNFLPYLNYFEPLEIKSITNRNFVGKAYSLYNMIYLGDQPLESKIGDYKIKFEHVPNRVLSLIANVENSKAEIISNGLFPIFQFIQAGEISAKELIQIYADESSEFTWIVRFIAFIMLFSGLFMVVYPLIVFCDFIPFLSSFVHKPLFSLVFILAAVIALCTLTLSWIFVRPILAGTSIIL